MSEMAERKEQLYMMKLHERISLDDKHTVLRVPGGWVYYNCIYTPGDNSQPLTPAGVFVPLSNEFQINAQFIGRKTPSR